jgi:thermostable 8-oxoguanine DNA glycosylase
MKSPTRGTRPPLPIAEIDVNHITDYCRTPEQLEELLIFCVLVAGKRAQGTARALACLLRQTHQQARLATLRPFQALRQVEGLERLSRLLRRHGIGLNRQKARTLHALLALELDLRHCSLEQLEAVPGIGPKTARMFLLHSRPGQRLACLDRHLLRCLAQQGVRVPRQTPGSRQAYLRLEEVVLTLADQAGMTPAEFDLTVWNRARCR